MFMFVNLRNSIPEINACRARSMETTAHLNCSYSNKHQHNPYNHTGGV